MEFRNSAKANPSALGDSPCGVNRQGLSDARNDRRAKPTDLEFACLAAYVNVGSVQAVQGRPVQKLGSLSSESRLAASRLRLTQWSRRCSDESRFPRQDAEHFPPASTLALILET